MTKLFFCLLVGSCISLMFESSSAINTNWFFFSFDTHTYQLKCSFYPLKLHFGFSCRLKNLTSPAWTQNERFLHKTQRSEEYLFLQNPLTFRYVVTSRIDYCNLLFVGFPRLKLQLVQNAAAHRLTASPVQMHIQLVLGNLHWLLIKY